MMQAATVVVVMPELDTAQKRQIRFAAAQYGREVCFFDTTADSLSALQSAEIALGGSPVLIGNAPYLRWFCAASAGVDHLIGEEKIASGKVLLTSSSGAFGPAIAEHIVMVLLMLLRQQQTYGCMIARKKWKRDVPIRSIAGSRILLAGTGDLGRAAAVRLRAFGPAGLTGVSRSGRAPEGLFDAVFPIAKWETLLPYTDALILCLPETRETRGILGAAQLALLPDGACVINVGRGSAIHEEALVEELYSGRLYAALDVFKKEPIPEASPLWACPNLLITPHVAGNTMLPATVQRIVDLFTENLQLYCEGLPLKRRVEPGKGY